jgi:hypothetical protein
MKLPPEDKYNALRVTYLAAAHTKKTDLQVILDNQYLLGKPKTGYIMKLVFSFSRICHAY